MAAIPLTPAQIEIAKTLRNTRRPRARGMGFYDHMCPREIAKRMGVSETSVIRALGLNDYRTRSVKINARYDTTTRISVPDSVLSERERAQAEITLHVALLGDPPFSRSALGKRNEQSRQETENGKAGTEWQDIARAWNRPQRRGGPITAQNGGRLLARLAQGHSYREATRREG